MKIDPAFCIHTNLKKSVRVETVNIPELGIEQLCLRIKVYCGDCKSSFIIKTANEGFSTNEVGVVCDELFVPLELPQVDELDVSASDLEPSGMVREPIQPRTRDNLH